MMMSCVHDPQNVVVMTVWLLPMLPAAAAAATAAAGAAADSNLSHNIGLSFSFGYRFFVSVLIFSRLFHSW